MSKIITTVKKAATAATVTLGLMSATAAFAGGPDAMAPPPSPYPQYYVGAGATWNGITSTSYVTNSGSFAPIALNAQGLKADFRTGWHVFVGANVSDHFGIEVNYTDPGDVFLNPKNSANAPLDGRIRLQSYSLSTYGTYRHTLFAPWFYFMAKLGIGWTSLKSNGHITQDNETAFLNSKLSSFGLAYGAGMGATFGAFGLRLMYTKIKINSHTDSVFTTGFNPDMLDLSAIWNFSS